MELLIAFLIAFGFANSSDKDELLKNSTKVESLFQSSGKTSGDLEAYRKKIIEMENDGM
jgi:hypothetical protein